MSVMSRWVICLSLGAIWLATSWALFRPGFFYLHDYVHGARIGELARALQDGQFPVRWTEHFGYGYGMPLFEFYAPLPYYLGAALWMAGVPIVLVLKFLWGFSSAVSIAGAYLAGKRWFGRWAGLVMAALFGLMPYRAMNLFVRGALSEIWGVMAMPWIALGVYQVIKGERQGWWITVFATIVLMLSHNLTTLMFLPLVAVWGGGLLVAESWRLRTQGSFSWQWFGSTIFKLISSMVVAGLVAAFYMVPALVEKDATQIGSILGGYFHYSQHFLYLRQFFNPHWGYGGSEWGPNDGLSFFLGWGQWLSLGLLGLALVWRLFHRQFQPAWRLLSLLGLSSLGLAVCLFLTLARSQSLWDASGFLYVIQFPWRWLGSGGWWLAVVAGAGVALWPKTEQRAVAAALVIVVTLIGHTGWFQPESIMLKPDDYYYTDSARIITNMSSILPDYISADLKLPVTPPSQLVTVPAGVENQIEVVVDRGHEKLLKTKFTTPILVQLAIANFPGWQAWVDGQSVAIEAGQPSGTMAITVPPGEHRLGVKLGSTPVRHWSDWASVAGVLILLAVAWNWSKQPENGSTAVSQSLPSHRQTTSETKVKRSPAKKRRRKGHR